MSEYLKDLADPNLPVVTEYDDKYDKSAIEEVFYAASAGDAVAFYELGSRYRMGVDGAAQDPAKAIEMYKAVLEQQNNVSAFYHIGYLLLDGVNGEEADLSGLSYLYSAYRLGDPIAAIQLGIQYEYGELIPQDLDKALEFYSFAVEHGAGQACFNIGEVYRRKNDIPEALKYYEQAKAFDDYREDAEEMIAMLTGAADASSDGPEVYVEQASGLLSSGKYMDAFKVISEGFRKYPQDLSVIYKLTEIDDIVLHAMYLSGRHSSDNEGTCRMLLDLIKVLRANSFGDPDFLDKLESDIWFFLGNIYVQQEQMDEALSCFLYVDVRHTPHAASDIFMVHLSDEGRYSDRFSQDAEMFKRALTSSNWPNNTMKSLAYLALSMLYARNFPGVPQDLQYGYECAQKGAELDPNVGSDELANYSRNIFGKLTYTF